AGKPGLDQRDGHGPERRDAQQRPAFGGDAGARFDRLFWRGERDDLHRRHHLARLDDGVFGQGAERHRLVDEVEPVEAGTVEDEQAARFGMQVGPAGKRVGRADIDARRRLGDAEGGGVFLYIAGIETGDDYATDPGLA